MKQALVRLGTALLFAACCLGADVARTPDGRLAIELPAGWQVVRLANAAGQVRARCVEKDAYVEVNSVAKADHTDLNLLRWAERCRTTSDRTSRLTDRRSDDLRPVTLAGRPGYVYAVTGTLNGLRRVFVKSYVETDRQFVEVMCWTTPTHGELADGDFHYLADHVRETVPVAELPAPP